MIRGYGNIAGVNNRLPVFAGNESNSHKSQILSRVDKNIKDVLNSISPGAFIKLTSPSSGTVFKIPFSASAILDAFKNNDGVMRGNLGFFKGTIKMIEVCEPESVQAVADCFTKIAELTGTYNLREYALFLFAGEKSVRFIVKKGNLPLPKVNMAAVKTDHLTKIFCLQPSVKGNSFIETPDGEKMISIGVLAHTHPLGHLVPSKKDFESLLKFNQLFNQNFSVLAASNNQWCLFDGDKSYPPPEKSLPLESLY